MGSNSMAKNPFQITTLKAMIKANVRERADFIDHGQNPITTAPNMGTQIKALSIFSSYFTFLYQHATGIDIDGDNFTIITLLEILHLLI